MSIVLSACMSVHHVHAVPLEARRGCHIPQVGVIGSCKLPWGYWELNPRPLEEKPEVLTAEPSLQPHTIFVSCILRFIEHLLCPSWQVYSIQSWTIQSLPSKHTHCLLYDMVTAVSNNACFKIAGKANFRYPTIRTVGEQDNACDSELDSHSRMHYGANHIVPHKCIQLSSFNKK